MLTLATSETTVHRLIEQVVLGPWPMRTIAEMVGILVIAIALTVALRRGA